MPEKTVTANQCNHINARGRRCRMNLAPGHDELCSHHLRQYQASQPDPETLAADLLDQTGDLSSSGEVNALLANVAAQFAHKRIDRKDAIAFGYLSQLLLWTLPGMEKVREAEREARSVVARNKDFARMRAAALASRAAANAEEAARNSQNTDTGNSSGPGSQPV